MRARMLAFLMVLLAVALGAQAQSSLTLRSTARISPDEPLLLRHVAHLHGTDAEALGSLVVLEDPDEAPTDDAGWIRIDIDRVRGLLRDELGDALGTLTCSGLACDVRVTRPPAPERGRTPITGAAAVPPGGPASELVGEQTVRGAVARKLAAALKVRPADLRLRFVDRDAAVLGMSLAGRVAEVTPTGSSDRVPVSIVVYEDGRVRVDRTIRVTVEIRRDIAVASRVIPRGAALADDDLDRESRWMPPSARALPAAEVAGLVARRRIEPSEAIERAMVMPPVLIDRGDLVTVRVVTPSLVVTREAYALESGVEGERIELAARSDQSQVMRAVVTGRGAALIWQAGPRGAATGTEIATEHRDD